MTSAVPNLPSLPAAKNSSSASYSAKTVFFYKEGDEHFQGVRVPVSKARYRTLESLLDDLNDKVPLYFGVRRVFTPRGKREVHSIDELENLGRYVCTSSRWTKGLTASERYQQLWNTRGFENERVVMQPKRQRSQTRNTNGPPPSYNSNPALAAGVVRKELQVDKKVIPNSILSPRPTLYESGSSQQVLFALNGMPNRVYRMQFRTRRLPQFDDVLQELSDMLHVPIAKLYTPDGNKITSVEDILANGHVQLLACQRHERPAVAGRLPPITIPNAVSPRKHAPPRIAAAPRRGVERGKMAVLVNRGENGVDPLPKITASAGTSSSSKQQPADKRLRRRTISKRKRKKIVGPNGATGSGPADDSAAVNASETHKAATMIQASFRGYRARKKLETRTALFGDYDDPHSAHRAATVIQAGVKGYLTRRKYRSGKSPLQTEAPVETSNAVDVEAHGHAATLIQTSFRGYDARRRLEVRQNGTAHIRDGEIGEEENAQTQAAASAATNDKKRSSVATITSTKNDVGETAIKNKEKVGKKKKDPTTTTTTTATNKKKVKKKKKDGACTYRISIYVGNRWAADCDGDLYVILQGEKSDSKKLVLKQSQQELRFQQNQMDSFDVEAPYVGLIRKITIGHENVGHGAGIYIDRMVVSELDTDSLQYFFSCAKWLDSGQVDGKIERVCPAAGYQILNEKTKAAAIDGVDMPLPSRGRWTIRLRAERAIPDSLSTLLYLTAYGSFGRSEMIPFPDNFTASAGAEYSFNVEFGELGELFKLRFDVEQDPNEAWLLEWVEMKDVDTGEEMRMYCNKWFCDRAPPGVKVLHPQTFREVAVLKIGVEPLPTFQYSVSLRTSTNLAGCEGPVFVQLSGEFGDSGSCKLPQLGSAKGNDVSVIIESVSLGRLMFVSLSAQVDGKGAAWTEGFRVLQEIYDRHGVPCSVAPDWIAGKVLVRDSTHAPYQFIFSDSRIIEPETVGTLKKQLALTDMEGLKTIVKSSKKKLTNKDEKKKTTTTKNENSNDNKSSSNKSDGHQQWRVFVTTGEHADGGTDCTPFLIVYGDDGVTKPTPLLDKQQRFTPGSTCQFDVDLNGIGRIFKIRVRLDTSGPNPMWYLKRIKMKDLSNGDELRFPVEMWLEKSDDNPEVSVELPAVWPDVPPLPSVLYNVTLCTGTNSDNDTDFDVYLIIFGQKGDTGKRFLRSPVGTQENSCLKPGNIDTFELEAVSVREISSVQIGVEPRKNSASWYLERVEILDPESEQLYIFKCDKWFSDSKGEQKLERILQAGSIVNGGT